ncbi:sugar phosphate isomerase/epimerase [Novosphingobium sp.]|uniref:sugar phosphate isomerase/epimerase family protein n=1 Tax=Novosphingobium sp. TaxID=1874826 RepID=UPI00286DFFDF|nr:sugar phosphate isomerase/epimerase [Novosphingobium sp.]
MAVNPRLSVDAMCSFRWPFEQDLALWTSLGVRHAGLLISKISDAPAQRMRQLQDAGIGCSTLIVGSYDLSSPSSWEATRASHRETIDLVAGIGGHSIYFTPGRTVRLDWDEDASLLAEAVKPTIAYGLEKGVKVAIEPTQRTSVSFITNLTDAVDMAELSGLTIVADFANIWTQRDLGQVFKRAMPHVALIQINDVVIGSSGKPAPGGRAHIGKGELPVQRFMQDVIDAGYTGVFDLEVVPADFSAATDETELREGILAASALLDAMGIS